MVLPDAQLCSATNGGKPRLTTIAPTPKHTQHTTKGHLKSINLNPEALEP